ncbi:MAG: tRNA-dihydrouridine synthase family protein [Desulfobacteraceae bacterium]|jgi:nifR3 family TIM-barrel protein|nr:tRNA-dihydrouridine synthase family protein [Desulfobacteraceae bacterium]
MIYNLAEYLRQPLKIGGKPIDTRLVLAPMSFLGHVAFRELVSRYGGYGLLFSEMCSAKAIPSENRFVSPYFRWRDEERSRLVCQIFGDDPRSMAEAACRIEDEGLFGVDINLGCSNMAICRRNCGAALLRSPDLAAEIVASVRKAIKCPLTVKFRTGWKDDPKLAVQLAKLFENAGADALIFHPRVAPDRRSRPAKWAYIGLVKKAVSIPVFGNGDVFDRNDCMRMIEETGCDGIALGRMAIARPWIFAELMGSMQTSLEIFLEAAIQLVKLLEIHYDPVRAIKRFRRFSFYFCANFRFGHALYTRILKAADLAEADATIRRFFEQPPEIQTRPNMNFFS